jgi:hypothetical protein
VRKPKLNLQYYEKKIQQKYIISTVEKLKVEVG